MGRWSLVVAAGLAIFMAQLDTTIVIVALPTIQRGLEVTTAEAAWVVLGYLVPLIGLSLISGRWIDRVGNRPALSAAAVGFAVASLAAGLSPGIAWLIAARFVQGAFGAVLVTLAPLLAVDAVGESARSRALAVVSALGPLGAMSGPAAGGIILDTVGWSWIFFLNVPLATVVVAIGWARLAPGNGLRPPPPGWVHDITTFGGAAVVVLLGLSLAADGHPWWLAVMPVAVPLLLSWRRSTTSAPVRRLISDRRLAWLHGALATSYTAVLLVQFLLPYYLQHVLGVTASITGTVILAYPAASAVAAPISGALADRLGRRLPALSGVGLIAVGLLLLVPLAPLWEPSDIAWRLGIVGLGFGLFATPIQATAMAIAPAKLIGTVSGSTNVARHAGIALGPALGTAAWALGGDTVDGMRVGIALACVLCIPTFVAVARGSRPDHSALAVRTEKR